MRARISQPFCFVYVYTNMKTGLLPPPNKCFLNYEFQNLTKTGWKQADGRIQDKPTLNELKYSPLITIQYKGGAVVRDLALTMEL